MISPVPGRIAAKPICKFSGAFAGVSAATAPTAAVCAF